MIENTVHFIYELFRRAQVQNHQEVKDPEKEQSKGVLLPFVLVVVEAPLEAVADGLID